MPKGMKYLESTLKNMWQIELKAWNSGIKLSPMISR